MEEDQPLNGSGGRTDSLLQGPISATFHLPLTRYPSHLFSGEHRRILFGDCGGRRSNLDDEDDDGERPFSGESCSYSKPILVLDVIWNLAFVLVSLVVLLSTFKEKPSTPLRAWICGYSLQCVLHVGFVYFEYRRRGFADLLGFGGLSLSRRRSCVMKRMESLNTIVSSIWWMFGFYWTVVGGQTLLQDSPRLYWLTVVFLAFDVFFIIFCIGVAFVIFLALCCCIPVLAFAYSMAIRNGASEDDIRSLPKYRFCQGSPFMNDDNEKKLEIVRVELESGSNNHINELELNPEDSECCICLSLYVEGVELYTLPCSHHFHCGCISKWLRINATCPLCKFNILRNDTLV
ncbi:E3 ubiquitin-protein ligase At4g11680-like [Humulus lupulus]|uniref:E3 ubiquitin-protein ligase At4g11680-like n=1 Tax=Humulus lupulus TaxID=3486 RepID=UPI002B40BBD6|nr:E3 ubiquitin-protein ligase At4g11680-like [Humulus lupulus]